MELHLEGKTAVVTGAAGGIGAATARLLVAEGVHVGLVDRDADRLTKVTQELRSQTRRVVVSAAVDLAKEETAREELARMAESLGSVDILISAAGVLRVRPVDDLTAADWIAAVRDNLLPMPVTARVLLEPMRQQRHGAVVVVVSDLARQPVGIDTAYEAAKAGLAVLIKVLAAQEAAGGIRVNGVAPGPVDTPMLDAVKQAALASHGGASAKDAMRAELHRRGQAMGRVGRPEEVADALVWLASERASYITGQILGVDGGSIQGLP